MEWKIVSPQPSYFDLTHYIYDYSMCDATIAAIDGTSSCGTTYDNSDSFNISTFSIDGQLKFIAKSIML